MTDLHTNNTFLIIFLDRFLEFIFKISYNRKSFMSVHRSTFSKPGSFAFPNFITNIYKVVKIYFAKDKDNQLLDTHILRSIERDR
jgi:hypothetical protein